MNRDDVIFKPVNISEIKPVYDVKGQITEWGITVTYDNQNIVPPHVKGARVTDVKNSDKNTLAEYHFLESVMKQGLKRAWLFRDAVLKQIARQEESR